MTPGVVDLAADATLLTVGIGVLYFGAEWLVRGAARLAASLGVSPIVVGLTIVSFGTSAPELVVCTVAALGGDTDLAMGNVLGSNLANIGLILGLTSIVRPLEVHARVVTRETPLMLLVTAGLFVLSWDLSLGRADGVLLLSAFVGYLVFVYRSRGGETPQVLGEYAEFLEASSATPEFRSSDVGWVVLGTACLVLGGYCIVEGAVQVASALGVSQVVIGLTVVAVGTSLPELATSVVAAARNESDIAVGNVIGSNIFNIAGILGVSSLLTPLPIPETSLSREFPAVMVVSLLVLPLLRTGWRIKRWEGALLLAAYIAAGVYLL